MAFKTYSISDFSTNAPTGHLLIHYPHSMHSLSADGPKAPTEWPLTLSFTQPYTPIPSRYSQA